MDAFHHIKNSGKFIKEYDNDDVVMNSNDKGPRKIRIVHDLQAYKVPQKSMSLWGPSVGPLTIEIKLKVQGDNTDKIKIFTLLVSSGSPLFFNIQPNVWLSISPLLLFPIALPFRTNDLTFWSTETVKEFNCLIVLVVKTNILSRKRETFSI